MTNVHRRTIGNNKTGNYLDAQQVEQIYIFWNIHTKFYRGIKMNYYTQEHRYFYPKG